MKKVAYVLMSALVALGSAACGPNENKKPEQKEPTNTDSGYKPPEQNKTEKVDFMEECKPATKNPCKDGLSCEELPNGKNYCVKECNDDQDCPEGFLCGDDFGEFEGLCVIESPYYGVSSVGDFKACPRDSLTNATLDYDLASNYFSDAGARDYLYGIGFCAPICGATGGFAKDGAQYYTCGKISLDEDDDTLGFNGETTTCMANTHYANILAVMEGVKLDLKENTISTCGIVRDDYYFCDENAIRCGHAPGRNPIIYGEDGKATNESFDGVNYCDFSELFYVPNGKPDANGLYTGFADFPESSLIGICATFCMTNAGCQCDDPNDGNCKLKDNEGRACWIFTADDNTDEDTDDYYGGSCRTYTKCNTASDCPTEKGYVAKCVAPSEKSILDEETGKTYVLKTVSEKFCEYESSNK